MSKISIIVPVYNVEQYLGECLDSILGQSLKDIEILCVNDGSKDNSALILDEYAKKDVRVRVFHRENKGVSKTRNEAILLAKGEFVAFMDADDFYPNKEILEKMYTKAKENNVLICGGGITKLVNNEIVPYNKNIYDRKNFFEQEGIINYEDYQYDYSFTRFIYNRDFLLKNKIFFPNYKRFEDPVFFVKAMYSAKTFYALKDITYVYRINSHKSNTSKHHQLDLIRGICDNLNFAKKYRLKKLYKTTLFHLFQHRKFFYIEYTYFSISLLLFILGFINDKYFWAILRKVINNYIYLKECKKRFKKYIKTENLCFWGASLFLEDSIKENNISNQNILGIIDNNPNRQGEKIGDYTIYSSKQITEINPEYILLTIKNNHAQRYSDIEEFLKENNLNIKLLPNIFDGEKRYV